MIVFLLCGAWHGAEWTFVLWGIYHGAFLIAERLLRDKRLPPPRPLRHAYALLVVIVGWVLFRSTSLAQAGAFLGAMAGFGSGSGLTYDAWQFLPRDTLLVLILGGLGSMPILPYMRTRLETAALPLRDAASLTGLLAVLLLSLMGLANASYNPLIYFRF